MHAYDVEALAILDGNGDNTIESDDDIPTDPILAAYELPHISGFEKQDEIVRKLQEEGKLFDASIRPEQAIPLQNTQGQSMTFDPIRGINMPNGIGGGQNART